MAVYRSFIRIRDPHKLREAVQRIVGRAANQGAAAAQLGIHRARVNQLVNGKRGTWIRAKLAKALWGALQGDAEGLRLIYEGLAPLGRWGAYDGWLQPEHERLDTACGELVAAIVRRPEGSVLRAFARRWDRVHDYRRVRLAIGRAVEPLLDHARTGGVERGLHELVRDGQLKSYLAAACRREALLLMREPDYKRVQPETDPDGP